MPRLVPYAYRDKLKKEIALLEDQGIIEPVSEPAQWCSSIVVTPKKDSNEV